MRAFLPVLRVSKAFRRAADEAGLNGVSPHTLRHTAVTWAMQGGAPMFDASAVFGMSVKFLEGVYPHHHHHPDAGRSVHAAMERRRPAVLRTV
jgi:integrase